MKVRVALVAGALLAGTVASTSHAATKVCNLVTDPKGDSSFRVVTTGPGAPGTPSMDLVGGDIASDGKQIEAVIRVDKLSKTDSQGPMGQAWFFKFVPKGLSDADSLFLVAYSTPTGGDEFWAGYEADHEPSGALKTSYPIKAAKGTFDTAKNEVRVWAPIADFGSRSSLLSKGTTFSTLTVEARRINGQRAAKSMFVGPVWVPIGGLTSLMDDAVGTKSYTAGAKSCVVLGK
jgi:hypothetical protein